MKKKLGPLQTYQWLAIGLAAGVIYYIYKARQANAAAASTGASPAQASDTTSLGPVDPTTGQPYALEALGNNSNGTNAQNSGPTSLAQELSDLGLIETLMANIGQLIPTGSQTPSGTNGANAVSSFTGQAAAELTTMQKAEEALAKQLKTLTKTIQNVGPKATATVGGIIHGGGTVNPGHTVTTHGGGIVHGGKQTASSSAPHNSQQHKNVQPPNHQKHPTHPNGGAGY